MKSVCFQRLKWIHSHAGYKGTHRKSTIDLNIILFLFCKMSRTQSFTSTDKEKNPPTPRSKIGHRRVDETGETTYKKVSVKKKHIFKSNTIPVPGLQLETAPAIETNFFTLYFSYSFNIKYCK